MNATSEVIDRFNRAFAEHDPTAFVDLVGPDCVMETIQPAPNGERYEGYEANLKFWQQLAADRSVSFDIEDTVIMGDHATIRWRLNSLIPEFQGPAYDYILTTDELPTYRELPDGDDEMVCKVKLFMPAGRWTYYVVAVTEYDDTPVMTGFCLSALGPDCDEFGDQSLDEFAGVRAMAARTPTEGCVI